MDPGARAYMCDMRERYSDTSRTRALIGLLVVVLFAVSIPFATVVSAMTAATSDGGATGTMSCHEPATPPASDNPASDSDTALQHLCCFTACIPLGMADKIAMPAFVTGAPALTALPTRPVPLSIGVDPPPPKA